MTTKLSFISVSAAIRSVESEFYGLIEKSTREWVGSRSQREIEESFFDVHMDKQEFSQQKAA